MAKDLTGNPALTERQADGVQVVWGVRLTADAPWAADSVQRWASRAYTPAAGAEAWTASLDGGTGIRASWDRLRVGGGLAAVGGFVAYVSNPAKESDLASDYPLVSDQLELLVMLADGTEDDSDWVQVKIGYLENTPYGLETWDLEAIDGTDKDFREIPAALVQLIDYPYAPLDAQGLPVPVVFGRLNVEPYDGTGNFWALAPCRCLDQFTRKYVAGLQLSSGGTSYQYYPTERRLAQVLNDTNASDNTFSVNDETRALRLYPNRDYGTNDVATWYQAADGNSSTTASVGATDNLDLVIGGVGKLGSLYQVTTEIAATGATYTYTVWYDTSSLVSGSAAGDVSVSLTASTWADDWDFELVRVEIDGIAGTTEVSQVYLDLRYYDQQSYDRDSLDLVQAVSGWDDQTEYYVNGTPVTGAAGTLLTNPVDILEAVLRASVLMKLNTASVNLTSFDTARTERTSWEFGFSLHETVGIDWLNTYAFEAGLHLFKDYQGKWKCVAQEKDAVPVHIFADNLNIAVANPTAPVEQWRPAVQFGRTPTRSLVNEVNFRYGLDRATGQYTKAHIASGRSRVSGTDATTAPTTGTQGTLTSPTSTFQTDGVAVADVAYPVGDKDYTVVSVDSETQLTISHALGVNAQSAVDFYVGPNLRGDMVRSQLTYKTENPLDEGVRGPSYFAASERSGYPSDLVQDDDTAGYIVDHLVDWRSQRRLTVRLSTFWNAVNVELGDFAWLKTSFMPSSKLPVALDTLSSGVTATTTTWSVGSADLFEADDQLYLDKEVVLVASVDAGAGTLTVTRAQCGTVAASHASGATVERLNLVRFEVTGIMPVPFAPNAAMWQLELQEAPPSYQPVGSALAAGTASYDAADVATRLIGGWAVNLRGAANEFDEYSKVSWAGADTGTY